MFSNTDTQHSTAVLPSFILSFVAALYLFIHQMAVPYATDHEMRLADYRQELCRSTICIVLYYTTRYTNQICISPSCQANQKRWGRVN